MEVNFVFKISRRTNRNSPHDRLQTARRLVCSSNHQPRSTRLPNDLCPPPPTTLSYRDH
jgi:hypothetical protein